MVGFPISYDIFLESDGKKVAVVQSYRSTVTNTYEYKIELTGIYATGEATNASIGLSELKDFLFVVVKPNKRIVYMNCNWREMQEDRVNDLMAEHIVLISTNREEYGE